MKEIIKRFLRRCGGEVELVFAESTVTVRAVLEPTTSVSWQNMRRSIRDLGAVPMGQYLYIGAEDISSAKFLRRRGKIFLPRRCEERTFGGSTLFYWGLCVPVGEEAAWNPS